MTEFSPLLRLLTEAKIDFILAGGLAAGAHGSARLTRDIDIVYRRDRANLERLVAALAPLHPYLRGAPPGLPFRWDVETVAAGLNFTLVTDLGWLDLLGEITGGGRYEDLEQDSAVIDLFSVQCRVLNLENLIATKRAAGRPKDFEAIAELELILERRKER